MCEICKINSEKSARKNYTHKIDWLVGGCKFCLLLYIMCIVYVKQMQLIFFFLTKKSAVIKDWFAFSTHKLGIRFNGVHHVFWHDWHAWNEYLTCFASRVSTMSQFQMSSQKWNPFKTFWTLFALESNIAIEFLV